MKAAGVQRFARRFWASNGSVLARKWGILDAGASTQISHCGSTWARCMASAARTVHLAGAGSNCMAADSMFASQMCFRVGQPRGYASGFKGQGGRMDIGARARQNQARRLWTIAVSGTLLAGFIIIVLNTFQENMMFYITPSQALEKYYIDPSKNKFRLGGLVLEGSVHNFKTSAEMEFVVTDLANEILVRYRGAVPDLFREGHSVVAEGFLRPIDAYPGRPEVVNDLTEELAEKAKQAGCYFTAVEVLAKHDEKYMPKEVAAAIERNKAAHEAQQQALQGTIAQLSVSPEPSPPPVSGKRKGVVAQTPNTAQH